MFSLKQIILAPVIIRFADIENYSVYILLITSINLIYALSNFGIGINMQRYMPNSSLSSTKQKIFYSQFFVHLYFLIFIIGVIYIFGDSILQTFLKDYSSINITLVISYLFFLFLYSQSINYFRFSVRAIRMGIGNIIQAGIAIAVIIYQIFSIGKIDLHILLLSEIIGFCCVFFIFGSIIVNEIGLKIFNVNIREVINEIKLGIPISLNVVLDFILSSADRYIIAIFLPIASVGLYNIIYVIGTIPLMFCRAVSTILPQQLSIFIDEKKTSDGHKIFKDFVYLYLVLSIGFCFGVLAVGDILVELITMENYPLSQWAAFIISLAVVFFGMIYLYSCLSIALLETKILFKVNILASTINLILNFVLLYIFKSILVAAITTLVSYSIAFVYIHQFFKNKWDLQYEYKRIFKFIVSGIFMYILIKFSLYFAVSNYNIDTENLNLTIFVALTGIGLFSYIIFLQLFDAMRPSEFKKFVTILGRK